MVEPTVRSHLTGDDEALLHILQLSAGVAAGFLCASLADDALLSGMLGFLGMWAGMFPFARRTWAAGLSAARYWKGVVFGTAVAAGLHLLVQ